MFKKLLLCLVLLIAVASSASAEPFLWSCHYSRASLRDGHSDYSDARFHRIFLQVEDDNHTATSQDVELQGIMTLSGGNYSYINAQTCKRVSGSSKTFTARNSSICPSE